MTGLGAAAGATLALGTAQFGLSYGLSKAATPVPPADIAAILAEAWAGGIRHLDTAAAYGDSERRIGEQSRPEHPFSIITKILPIGRDVIAGSDVAQAIGRFKMSLRHLGTKRVDTLLVHNAGDLLAEGGVDLHAALADLVSAGRVGRLGVSVYTPEMLDKVLDRFDLGVVQLPLNVFDQRFLARGRLSELAANGIEIHVRSVFLQGLLLRSDDTVPSHLKSAAEALSRFRARATQAGMTPQLAALSFAANVPGVARLVVGVDRLDAMRVNLAAFDLAKKSGFDATDLALADTSIIDPRQWNE